MIELNEYAFYIMACTIAVMLVSHVVLIATIYILITERTHLTSTIISFLKVRQIQDEQVLTGAASRPRPQSQGRIHKDEL